MTAICWKSFLAEIGARGTGPFEEAADNLGHAVEVAGTHGALHHGCHLAEVEDAGVFLGIYLLDGGDEGVVHAGGLQLPGVGLFGVGVGAQVLGIVELRGVDEYADYNNVILAACAFHKADVSGVQGTHGGHEAHCLSGLARGLGCGFQ